MKRAFSVIALSILSTLSFASVAMPAVFSDNMVLQRDLKVKVWGWAAPSEEIQVLIDDQKWLTNADKNGDWSVTLSPHKAGGPYRMTIQGANHIEFKNVMYGDVWVCSGQSNMEFQVPRSINGQDEVKDADHPNIRLYLVPLTSSESPLATIGSGWSVCSPQTVTGFSAVGYFFGRELASRTGVTIGLISTSWGGTPVESWTSREALRRVPETSRMLDEHLALMADPARMASATPQQKNKSWYPGALYNGMIAPFTNFAIRGAIWYQGESNTGNPLLYNKTFPNMIRDWRKAWGIGDFPFYFVQLANFVGNPGWPGLREAQFCTLDLPNTGMAVTIDIGNHSDIHPKNKQEVGRRLALWAQRDVYHEKNLVVSGPLYSGMETKGSKIVLSFDYANGLKSKDGGPLVGFEIAGADGNYVEANAVIDGNKVVVSSPSVTVPISVRYAWAPDPKQNLTNAAGLPASPFTTEEN